jgi:glyoxylase-like metal-dependent hydrolase (beta-lactamase superfamily II)
MYYKCSILIIFLFGSINSSGQIISGDDSDVNNSEQAIPYKANKIGVIQVKDSIFMLKGRGGNIGVSVGEDGVLIIDSQFPDASADIVQRVRSLSQKPIKLLVNTHHHGDHVGGNSNLTAEGALVFSHEKARRRMAAPYMKAAREKYQRKIDSILDGQGDKISTVEGRKKAVRDAEKIVGKLEDHMNIPGGTLPVVSFSKDLTFNFNGEKIMAIHIPYAHTDGDVMLYFTKSNVLHTGDAFVNKTYPYIDSKNSGSLGGYLIGLQKIIELINTETRVIPGHGAIATKDDVSYTYNMIRFLSERIALYAVQKKTEDQVASMSELTKEYDDKGFGEGFVTTEKFVRTMYKEVSKKYKKED